MGSSRLMRDRRSRAQGDGGAAAVEFAMLVPILLALVFGITSFGLLFHQQIQLSAAAREGARSMAIKKVQATAIQAVKTAAPNLNPANMTISVPSTCATDTNVTVTVSYPFQFEYILGRASRTLTATGVMRCGG